MSREMRPKTMSEDEEKIMECRSRGRGVGKRRNQTRKRAKTCGQRVSRWAVYRDNENPKHVEEQSERTSSIIKRRIGELRGASLQQRETKKGEGWIVVTFAEVYKRKNFEWYKESSVRCK